MPDTPKFQALMAEFRSLDRTREAARMRQLLEEAIPELDRTEAPRKWAALYSTLGQLREGTDPHGAVEAYRKALEVWTADQDHDSWAVCHLGAGLCLMAMQPLKPEAVEQAIAHLEAAEPDHPFVAQPLALLYRLRPQRDPLENWRNRVRQLELAQAQISRADDPVGWAKTENELALALAAQPDGNFFALMAERRKRHHAALDALGDDRGAEYIQTCLYLSETSLFGYPAEAEENSRKGEAFARLALEAAETFGAPVQRGAARLAVGRALATDPATSNKDRLREALNYFAQAAAEFRDLNNAEMEANALSLRVNALAQLIRLGETAWVEDLVTDAVAALERLDPEFYRSERRTILQVEGEALLDADQPEPAAACFEAAVAAAREALAQATTPEGRTERISEFRDTSALLGFCYLRTGREEDALQALEDGKGRIWVTAKGPEEWAGVTRLIPSGGALLFPDFARDPGAVLVVTAAGRQTVWLPAFGKSRLMELQRGAAELTELGGWLKAYYYQNSQPANFRSAIDAVGETLYNEIWVPVIDALTALGVREGAELVWFPQGGSGVFPMHAAWRTESETRKWLLDQYAVRYAPSVKALAARTTQTGPSGHGVLVVNPLGDLRFAELESAWVLKQTDASKTKVFRGDDATKGAILGAFDRARCIHLATHALFDIERPMASHLMLANSEKLPLYELLPLLARDPPELVALSACETGMAQVSVTPDEFLGFPAALLHAGVRTVIATLWPVADSAAAPLMSRFYAELANPGTSPAEALRRAQIWLRDIRVSDLLLLLRQLRDEPDPVGHLASQWRTEMRSADPESRPFAEAYFWAAFTVSGQ